MTEPSPYRAPESALHPESSVPERPRVVFWYVVYCASMCGMYALIAVFSVLLSLIVVLGDEPGGVFEALMFGIAMPLFSVPFAALFLVGVVLRPGKAAWYMGFVNIAVGLSSPCFMPATIPLLVFWVRNDVKHYMGISPGTPVVPPVQPKV